MRTLSTTALLFALIVNSVHADTKKSLKDIRAKYQQGLELSQEEIKLLESTPVEFTKDLGLDEEFHESAYNSPSIQGPQLEQATEAIEVVNDIKEEPATIVSAKEIDKEKTIKKAENKTEEKQGKKEYSFFDKAKALVFGPPTIVANTIVNKVKKVNQARKNANHLIKEQAKSNIRTSLGFVRDNYNTLQAVSREYADLNPVTKSLNDFRIKLSQAGIKLALYSNPVIVGLYNKFIAKKTSQDTDRDVAADSDKSITKKQITDKDFERVKTSIGHLSEEELIGAIAAQEIKLDDKDHNIKNKLSDLEGEPTMAILEKMYFDNALLLGEELEELTQDEIAEDDHQESETSYSKTSYDDTSLDASDDNSIEVTSIKESITADTASCNTEQTTVLSEQIAELTSSFDDFKSEQLALNSSLIQTMTMNNLMMSQNMMMMSQMMMNMQMMQMQNSIGERKGSLTDIMDSHYKNYMTFPTNDFYNPNAQNLTPSTSNYRPESVNPNSLTTYSSPSFESVGPVNGMYSPGYNFSFGNTFEQPRLGPTQAAIDKSLKIRDIAVNNSDAWFLESDPDHFTY